MLKGSSNTVQLCPRLNRAIIAGFAPNYRVWMQFFFFFRIDNASVEESCIPILRTIRGRKGTFDRLHASFGFDNIQSYIPVSHFAVTNPLPPAPDGLTTIIGLLRSGEFYWALLTLKRVRRAVALHHFLFQPDLPVEEGDEPSMDGFVPCEAPIERERSRTRKDKHIAVEDDEAGGGCFPENLLGDYFNGES